MPGTRIVGGKTLTIANGATLSDSWSHSNEDAGGFGDADGITFFIPAMGQSATIEASDLESPAAGDWYQVITGVAPVTIASGSLPAAVTISPVVARRYRVKAGASVAGAQTIKTNKYWRGFS